MSPPRVADQVLDRNLAIDVGLPEYRDCAMCGDHARRDARPS
jgi:hypothetical protein